MTNTKGLKFLNFLRRIFRKNWRPPMQPKNEDELTESCSEDEFSSEGEEDTKSINSTDMTAIRLDESHCPPGLERSMYELAFKLRADRHELEKNLNDALKQIDSKCDEVKEAQKNVKYHTDVYNKEQEKLAFGVSAFFATLIRKEKNISANARMQSEKTIAYNGTVPEVNQY